MNIADLKQKVKSIKTNTDEISAILNNPIAHKQKVLKELNDTCINLVSHCGRDTCDKLNCSFPIDRFCIRGGISNKLSVVSKINTDKLARIDAMKLMIKAIDNGS